MLWHSNDRNIDANRLKEYLIQQLKQEGINIERDELDELYAQKAAEIKVAGMILDNLVPGKQKLTAVFFEFQRDFPKHMRRRQIKIFAGDLCKYIIKSKYVKELVNEIDNKLMTKMVT